MDERARVVAGIDGSPGGRAALAYALRDAARRDASVEAVAAFLPPDYPSLEYWAPMYGPDLLVVGSRGRGGSAAPCWARWAWPMHCIPPAR